MGLSGAKNICCFEFLIQPDWIQATVEGKRIKRRGEDRALPLLLHFRPVKITRPVLRGAVSFLYPPLSLARASIVSREAEALREGREKLQKLA